MWNWLRDHRRKKLVEMPFPPGWERIIQQNVPYAAKLTPAEHQQLRGLVQVFVAEKYWEGCGGLELTDEIRVTIAAQACILVLALPHDLYSNVRSILVYPSTVVPPERRLSSFEVPNAPIGPPRPIAGQAFAQGPVILVWDAIRQNALYPGHAHNVVFHEFAHKLDMLDGFVDGTPPLHTRQQHEQWRQVCEREYFSLRDRAARGEATFLDAYGSVNPGEFFAVATEHFFEKPHDMRNELPGLYEVLKEFYLQDPAARP